MPEAIRRAQPKGAKGWRFETTSNPEGDKRVRIAYETVNVEYYLN